MQGPQNFLPFGFGNAQELLLSPLHFEPLAALLARSTARRGRAPLAACERLRESRFIALRPRIARRSDGRLRASPLASGSAASEA